MRAEFFLQDEIIDLIFEATGDPLALTVPKKIKK